MKIGSMNNSSEVHRLANSIAGLAETINAKVKESSAGLAETITEIINANVKEANVARASANMVAEKPFRALTEARLLLQTPHYTAAFIHAAIASEVMLKGIILKPILQGFVHSDSIAPFIVALAFPSNSIGFERIGTLLDKIFKDVSNFNLMAFKRKDGVKILWEEICDVQKRRNPIMHRAEIATKADAKYAIAVAAAVTEELFPVFAKSLGYHLHDGFRLCGDQYCLSHPEYGERNRMIATFEKK